MGGKALSVPSIRLSPTAYRECESKVIELFDAHGIKLYPIAQIKTKESFGDLDIVVDIEVDRATVERIIYIVSNELVKNSDVWSFGINGFQVDIVFSNCPEYTAHWMAYG